MTHRQATEIRGLRAVLPIDFPQWLFNLTIPSTSLGAMINPGFPTYGPSKAALEPLSAIMAKAAVTHRDHRSAGLSLQIPTKSPADSEMMSPGDTR
jgi:hypothetical protein